MQEKATTTDYATVGNTYTILIPPTQAPPTSVTHKQMKGKRKGSRDFPCRVGPLLAAGVSRAPPARVLRRHVFSVLTRAQSSDVRFSENLTPPALGLGPVLGAAFTPN